MCEFRKITLEERQEWDRIAGSFSVDDVYYRNGYVKGYRLHGDGEPLLLYYSGDGIRAMNVVMKRDIHEFGPLQEVCRPGEYFDFSTPYGYGGMVAEGELTEEALATAAKAYRRFCRQEKAVSEFVRFLPLNDNAGYGRYFYDMEEKGPAVSINLTSHDTIWNNMKGCHRNRIRRARNSGITVSRDTGDEAVKKFMEIYKETMDRAQAQSYYYFGRDYYDSLCKEQDDGTVIFFAELEGQVISAVIILYGSRYAHYHLCGTRNGFQSYAPAGLLVYEAAKWAMAAGCERLYLGGGLGARVDSLYQFKKKFNTEPPHTFYVGKTVYDETAYEKLTAARNMDQPPEYFPAYRGV